MCDEKTLNDIGMQYNTDKASQISGRYPNSPENEILFFNGRDYLRHYEFFLSSLKLEKFTFIELGVLHGASMKVWKDYFQNAQIVGVDYRLETKIEEERIDFICADSSSCELLDKLDKYKGTIKCILDDSSHAWGNQRTTFEMLFPLLESGGYYIVEDLEFGSKGTYTEPCCWDSQSFFDYVKDRVNIMQASANMDRQKYRPFFYQFPPHIQQIELSLDFVTFIPGAIIFRKA